MLDLETKSAYSYGLSLHELDAENLLRPHFCYAGCQGRRCILQIYMKCLLGSQFCCVSLVSPNSAPLSTKALSARLSLYMIGVEVLSTLAILNGPRLEPPGMET